MTHESDVLILGAGPAGLTAAYELSRRGVQCTVLERDSVPGGIAKTVEYKGFLFDLGGHRFYTKVPLIEKMWFDVMGADFLERPRLSRIFYRSHFFHYPLEPLNVIQRLGPVEVVQCAASFLKAALFPQKPETHFAAWVSNRFGKRLFEMFFRSYTEKVWGIPCTELSAEWAAQRIRGLSFSSVVRDAFRLHRPTGKAGAIKTLIREFHYPRRGPGMMWSKFRRLIEENGSEVILNTPVERIRWSHGRIDEVEAGGRRYRADQVISSLAIRDFLRLMDPVAPGPLQKAASQLNYRDFITVGLIVRGTNLFPDNWIYVHDPSVNVGRIQNYTNWSPEMSPDPSMSSVGMEYFCSENDPLWSRSEAELTEMAKQELAALGLARLDDIVDGKVVRVPKAYPVYDDSYIHGLEVVKEFLAGMPNLQMVGRNGMHRYNNQDHSMLTALMAAHNVLGADFDLWKLHGESEYLEEGMAISDEDIARMEASQPWTPVRAKVLSQQTGD